MRYALRQTTKEGGNEYHYQSPRRGNGGNRGGSFRGQLRSTGPPRSTQPSDSSDYDLGFTNKALHLTLGQPPRGSGWGPYHNQRCRGYFVDHQDAWKARSNGYPDYQSPGLGYLAVEPEWEANIPTSNHFFPLADRDGPEGNFVLDHPQPHHFNEGNTPTLAYQAPNGLIPPPEELLLPLTKPVGVFTNQARVSKDREKEERG